MTINLTAIKAAALTATAGPWVVDNDDRPGMSWNRNIVRADDPNIAICFMTHSNGKSPSRDKATADLIAACSPGVVLALIAAVEAAKAVAYSNGFDAAYPDKLSALRAALEPFK